MSDAKKIVDSITNKSLEDYGVKAKSEVPEIPEFLDRRQTHARPTTTKRAPASKSKAKRKPVPSTSREEYIKRFTSAQTPSASVRPVIDVKLSVLAKMPVLEQTDAVFEPDLYDEMVYEVSRYMCDVMEGAGFVYRHGASDSEALRKLLGEFIQTRMAHIDPSGRRRFVAVRGGE